MGKKVLVAVSAAILLVALSVVPAFAEGYNNGGINYKGAGLANTDLTNGANAGRYVNKNIEGVTSAQIDAVSGPHGGYATTTAKCQDCHSTHYATGSYRLLRADSREQACDFCHVGGGGSKTNIMMDNSYSTTSAVVGANQDMGSGTGHTLGYKGNAPAGINPAFSDSNGFACFDCHTPHGNSARVLETFGAPGDIAGKGVIAGDLYEGNLLDTMLQNVFGMHVDGSAPGGFAPGKFVPRVFGTPGQYAGANIDSASIVPAQQPNWAALNAYIGAVQTYTHNAGWNPMRPDLMLNGKTPKDAFGDYMTNGPGADPKAANVATAGMAFFSSYQVLWGIDADKGNIVTKFYNIGPINTMLAGFGVNLPNTPQTPNVASHIEVWKKPLFPKGRFLLLKNPNDMLLAGPTGDLNIAAAGATADNGTKKMSINWDNPSGPAASWGPLSMSKQEDTFPLQFPWAPKGVAMENEMCADCHDGAAGSSTQAANVWLPNPSDSTTGTYQVSYSHDSNPKGCARQQILNPGDDNNMGPHCRNCHTGAASCNQCHGPNVAADGAMSRQNWESYWTPGDYTAWDGNVVTGAAANSVGIEGKTTYIPPAYVRTSAVSGANGLCVDGGFSYPHRTLGANMLKDSLYGVDFDGKTLKLGDTRGMGLNTAAAVANKFGNETAGTYFGRNNTAYPESGGGFETALINKKVDNLDSVCIDCHGDATTYAGDLAKVDKWYFPSNFDVSGATPPNHVTGWEVLLKGLP